MYLLENYDKVKILLDENLSASDNANRYYNLCDSKISQNIHEVVNIFIFPVIIFSVFSILKLLFLI